MQHEQHPNGSPIITRDSVWAINVFSEAYGSGYPFWDKPLVNCGIIGGYTKDVLKLLADFEKQAQEFKEKTGNEGGVHDMSFMNYLVHRMPVLTGMPLHTIFKSNDDNNSNAYIIHK